MITFSFWFLFCFSLSHSICLSPSFPYFIVNISHRSVYNFNTYFLLNTFYYKFINNIVIRCNINILVILTKGGNEIKLIIDDEYEHDIHVQVDAAAAIEDEQDNANQSQYHLTYSRLNDKLREKLTPIFNRKHYSSLPQTSLGFFENISRRNSCIYSAYNKLPDKISQVFRFKYLAYCIRVFQLFGFVLLSHKSLVWTNSRAASSVTRIYMNTIQI